MTEPDAQQDGNAHSDSSAHPDSSAVRVALRRLAGLAPGSTLAMSFLLPAELLEPEDRQGLEFSQKGAAASGTPFLSLFPPQEILGLARDAGFREVRHVSAADQNARYFAGRTDGLRSGAGEDLLVARTS